MSNIDNIIENHLQKTKIVIEMTMKKIVKKEMKKLKKDLIKEMGGF